jgi:hypothetical protein
MKFDQHKLMSFLATLVFARNVTLSYSFHELILGHYWIRKYFNIQKLHNTLFSKLIIFLSCNI